jgi:hypothetical protein
MQRLGDAVISIISALLILVGSSWFFSNTGEHIKMINNWGAELETIASSTNVLLTSEKMDTSKSYSTEESGAILENQLFNLMVKRPYLLMQYGTSNEAKLTENDANRIDKLLKYKTYTLEGVEERKRIVKDEVETLENHYMSPSYNNQRLGIIFLTVITTISLAIPVLLLAGVKFLLQIFLLGLLIFASVPLTIALIPTYSAAATKWVKNIIGVLMMKAGLVLLMAVMIGLATLIYETLKSADGVQAYLFISFIMVLSMIGLFMFRNNLFEVATSGYISTKQTVDRMVDQTKNYLQQGTKTGLYKTGLTRQSVKGTGVQNKSKARSLNYAKHVASNDASSNVSMVSNGNYPEPTDTTGFNSVNAATSNVSVPKSPQRQASHSVVSLDEHRQRKGGMSGTKGETNGIRSHITNTGNRNDSSSNIPNRPQQSQTPRSTARNMNGSSVPYTKSEARNTTNSPSVPANTSTSPRMANNNQAQQTKSSARSPRQASSPAPQIKQEQPQQQRITTSTKNITQRSERRKIKENNQNPKK